MVNYFPVRHAWVNVFFPGVLVIASMTGLTTPFAPHHCAQAKQDEYQQKHWFSFFHIFKDF